MSLSFKPPHDFEFQNKLPRN